jgi:hypothetical protein
MIWFHYLSPGCWLPLPAPCWCWSAPGTNNPVAPQSLEVPGMSLLRCHMLYSPKSHANVNLDSLSLSLSKITSLSLPPYTTPSSLLNFFPLALRKLYTIYFVCDLPPPIIMWALSRSGILTCFVHCYTPALRTVPGTYSHSITIDCIYEEKLPTSYTTIKCVESHRWDGMATM